MTRLAALLALLLLLLVACNSGPLQWTDATTWRSRDAYIGCDTPTRPVPELFCLELSAVLLSAPARLAPSTAPTIAVGTCSATVDPRTSAVTGQACTLHVTHRGRPYAVTVRPLRARLSTDGAAMTIEATWSIGAPASDVNAMPATGTLTTTASYTPVG
jgi:hypothetical protein